MRLLNFFLPSILLFVSCSKDSDLSYPIKLNYSHTEITQKRVYLLGDNETYSVINNYRGYLDSLRDEFVVNYYHFTKDTLMSPVVESIELLNEDSIKLKITVNGIADYFILHTNLRDDNDNLINPSAFEMSFKWNKDSGEIRACASMLITIPQTDPPYLDQNFCSSQNPDTEFQRFLDEFEFSKNDTSGIYLMELVYR